VPAVAADAAAAATVAAPAAESSRLLPSGLRLHIVTGKGGTGKSTVAAALAIALASGGRRVLLAEVEGRQGIAQLFDTPPLPYEERRVATAPGGGEVFALAIDAEDALLDYLETFYGLKRAGRALKRFGVVDFATTVAPGMRDVLLTGKVKESVVRTARGRHAYDAVVLDAPPTGRISRFLNVTEEVAGLARAGPIKGQADGVITLLHSSQTAVHIVTILEEMPVQETVDAVAELGAVGLPVGAVIVNMVREPLLSEADLERAGAGALAGPEVEAEVKAALSSTGYEATPDLVRGLLAEAVDHASRVVLEREGRQTLAALARPTVELPLLPGTVDTGTVYRLAELLVAEGVVV